MTLSEEIIARARPKVLTKRQWEIVLLMSEGLSHTDISNELEISVESVHQNRRKIMTKLHVIDHHAITAEVRRLVLS